LSEPENTTVFIQNCLDRLRTGDPAACDPLINRAYHRIKRLAQRMWQDYQRIRPYADDEDAAQEAILRLRNAVAASPPATVQEFYRLASTQIRRTLIDLTRHFFGPHGDGANQIVMPSSGSGSTSNQNDQQGNSTFAPDKLAIWREFHEAVNQLPEEEREVFDLLWYHEINQAEAAETLGVSVPTVKRRWMAARLRLQQTLQNQMPGL
jgi:RNA polymerase sigma-70 factor (ECF subfamily)